MERIFDEYCTNIVLAKLSPGANSQINEALNSIIGSKNRVSVKRGPDGCGWKNADGKMRIKKIENRNKKYKNACEKKLK